MKKTLSAIMGLISAYAFMVSLVSWYKPELQFEMLVITGLGTILSFLTFLMLEYLDKRGN